MRMRGPAAAILALALAAAIVAWTGPAHVADALRHASWPHLALAALALVAFFAARGVRWSLLLAAHGHVPARDAACTSAVGWSVSTVVPFKAGDAVRAAWLSRRTGIGLAAVAGSVAVERALDILALALAASVALLLVALVGGAGLPGWAQGALAVAWIVPLAGLAALLVAARLLPEERRKGRWLRALGTGLDALPALAREPRRLAAVVAATLAVTTLQVLVPAFLVLALVPHATTGAALLGAPLFLLTFAIPLTPAHLGTYEAGFLAAFHLAGVASAGLLAAAVAAHLVGSATTLLLGGGGAAYLVRAPRSVPA